MSAELTRGGPGLPVGHVGVHHIIMIRLLSPSHAPAPMVASSSSLSSTLTPRDPGPEIYPST